MKTNRRGFIGSLGAALLGARLLDGGRAHAQTAGAKRLVVFYSPNGTVPARWRPTGSGAAFDFPAGGVLEPLRSVRDALTVIGGLEYRGTRGHDFGMLHMLTASGVDPNVASVTGGRSVDQYVASALPTTETYRSLELGVQASMYGEQHLTRMSYAGYGQWLPPNDDPRAVHRRLFGGAKAERLYAKRQSVLDLVRAEIGELSGRLSAEEKVKLDIHLDALRDVERGVEPRAVCTAAPALAALDPLDNDNFPLVGRQQMDLMVAALACDLTRVASIQWSHAASETVCRWLGHSESLHSLSHMEPEQAAGVEQFIDSGRWFAEQFRYLVSRMASLPEPGGAGSLLDNSIVLWTSEIGDGVTHVCKDVPIVLAGSAGGRIEPGRYVRYEDAPHNQLFTSICWAMGLNNPSFGDEAYGVGGLDGLLT